MLTSNLGRRRFLAYCAALFLAELVAMAISVAATIGFDALARSRPGPGREGVALAILIVSLLFWCARSNLAWRRSRDARGSKSVLCGYVLFSLVAQLLQAGMVLVYRFDGENATGGLTLLLLGVGALWWQLFLARSAEAPRSGPAQRQDVRPAAEIALAGPSRPIDTPRQGFGRRGLTQS